MDITPQQPVTLAGYESRKDLSEGVHDPLSARVIAFEQDRRRLVLVSIDNLGFYNDTAAPLGQAILDACGLKPSELFLCAIHTHSAPALTLNPEKGHSNNVAYTRALQGKLVEAVRAALAGLAPVELTDKKLLSRRRPLLNAARVNDGGVSTLSLLVQVAGRRQSVRAAWQGSSLGRLEAYRQI